MADDDPRLVMWCRMGLLAGAALHWAATAILLWQQFQGDRVAIQFSSRC
jgi:hypothetical protein